MYSTFDSVGILLGIEGPKPNQIWKGRESYEFVRLLVDWDARIGQDPRRDMRATIRITAQLPRVKEYLKQCRRGDLLRIRGYAMTRISSKGNPMNELQATTVQLMVAGLWHHLRGKCRESPEHREVRWNDPPPLSTMRPIPPKPEEIPKL